MLNFGRVHHFRSTPACVSVNVLKINSPFKGWLLTVQKHCVERFLFKFVGGKPPKAFTEKKNIFTSWLQQFHYFSNMKNTFGMNSDLELSSPLVIPRIGRFYEKKSLGETGKRHLAPWKEIHVFSFQLSLLKKKKQILSRKIKSNPPKKHTKLASPPPKKKKKLRPERLSGKPKKSPSDKRVRINPWKEGRWLGKPLGILFRAYAT